HPHWFRHRQVERRGFEERGADRRLPVHVQEALMIVRNDSKPDKLPDERGTSMSTDSTRPATQSSNTILWIVLAGGAALGCPALIGGVSVVAALFWPKLADDPPKGELANVKPEEPNPDGKKPEIEKPNPPRKEIEKQPAPAVIGKAPWGTANV